MAPPPVCFRERHSLYGFLVISPRRIGLAGGGRINLGRRRGGGCITGRGGKRNGESERQDTETGVTRLRVRGQGSKNVILKWTEDTPYTYKAQ